MLAQDSLEVDLKNELFTWDEQVLVLGKTVSMDYLIIHNHEAVGKVVEPRADTGMGVVVGPFVPFPAYEGIRPVFRIFTERVEAELVDRGQTNQERVNPYREQDALRLSITTITDLPVETHWIHIEDFSETLGDDGYEAHFCVDYANGTFFSNTSLWDCKGE